jgi:hypothetical protein
MGTDVQWETADEPRRQRFPENAEPDAEVDDAFVDDDDEDENDEDEDVNDEVDESL